MSIETTPEIVDKDKLSMISDKAHFKAMEIVGRNEDEIHDIINRLMLEYESRIDYLTKQINRQERRHIERIERDLKAQSDLMDNYSDLIRMKDQQIEDLTTSLRRQVR